MRRNFWIHTTWLIAIMCAGSAHAADPEVVVSPNEIDYSIALETVEPVISNLKSNKVLNAIELAFKANPFAGNMKSQISVLVGQINTIMEIYGPIKQCELAERSHLGSYLIRLKYVCQHDNYLTEWNFRVAKTAKSVSIMSVDFEDAK